ncbi:MAG: KilA-N domain-containing protein [Bacteroidetes bacterium]|nr:KilA-N domain-containing protein [Bacteroidota bacterium]
MSDITKFDYEGKTISFEFSDGSKMINATEMARPFKGKLVADFLRTKQTQEYISLLKSRYGNLHIGQNSPKREVLRVVKGGEPGLQGTWMDEKLALKFAAWLSVEFELWVYDRIYELITTGETKLQNIQPSTIASSLRLIAAQLEEQDRINQEVRTELDNTAERLDELESKIISTDENYYTIAGYANLAGLACPLHQAKIWGKAATTLSKEKGYPTGTAHDERFGTVRTYHQDILRQIVE